METKETATSPACPGPAQAASGGLEERPLIGIACQMNFVGGLDAADCFTLRPRYVDFVERWGGVAVLLPPRESAPHLLRAASACDGVLLAGGNDVDPAAYGRPREPVTLESNPFRDASEKVLARWCWENDVPLLGICRGMQMANVALGGVLCQDVLSREGALAHFQQPPYDRHAHLVRPTGDGPIARFSGGGDVEVNSVHHQGIESLATQLRVGAVAQDGLVECVYAPDVDFYVGVQWHPEFMPEDPLSAFLCSGLVQAAKRNHERARRQP